MGSRRHQINHCSPRRGALLCLLGLLSLILLASQPSQAGGPLVVTGPTFDTEGVIITWDTSTEVQYRTDGGGLGVMNNSTANARVGAMFQVWEDVATATIGFNRAGPRASQPTSNTAMPIPPCSPGWGPGTSWTGWRWSSWGCPRP